MTKKSAAVAVPVHSDLCPEYQGALARVEEMVTAGESSAACRAFASAFEKQHQGCPTCAATASLANAEPVPTSRTRPKPSGRRVSAAVKRSARSMLRNHSVFPPESPSYGPALAALEKLSFSDLEALYTAFIVGRK